MAGVPVHAVEALARCSVALEELERELSLTSAALLRAQRSILETTDLLAATRRVFRLVLAPPAND